MQFRLTVLKDLYESGANHSVIARKYGISRSVLITWARKYENYSLPLPKDLEELEHKVYMAKKKRESVLPRPKSEVEKLQDEVARLRKALEYSELRNEAYETLLEIGRKEYNLDLLKKAGARQ